MAQVEDAIPDLIDPSVRREELHSEAMNRELDGARGMYELQSEAMKPELEAANSTPMLQS